MFSDLFNQDTIKEIVSGTTVCRNLHNLHTKFEGVNGLATGLDSNTKVIPPN
jgi:hypothetical protein